MSDVNKLDDEEEHFNSIVRTLREMTPWDRRAAILESCDVDAGDWHWLFEYAVFSIGDRQYNECSDYSDFERASETIKCSLRDTIKCVFEEFPRPERLVT